MTLKGVSNLFMIKIKLDQIFPWSLNWYFDLMNILLWMLFTNKLFGYQGDSISSSKFDLQNHKPFQSHEYFMTLSQIDVQYFVNFKIYKNETSIPMQDQSKDGT